MKTTGSTKSTLGKRLRVGATVIVAALGVAVAGARPAEAHTCAQVTVWVQGTPTPVGSCHYPGDLFDVCYRNETVVAGNGEGVIVCVEVPV
jgi:hypothetical protein